MAPTLESILKKSWLLKIKSSFFAWVSVTAQLFSYPLTSGGVVVGDDKPYCKVKDLQNDVEVIYTKDNIPFAKQTLSRESTMHDSYAKFFDWKLDETLYVGLVSDYNQIANGFSSQWPNNRQINYIGGTQLIDSFASTSWLDTLLYHETAHNYQGNIKASPVSRTLHSVLGNGSFITFLPIIVPNVMENSFMLEGNAVLNESWHGNGGRLYNGFYKAQTILQAKANKITPAYVYNSRLEFPYGDIVYMQGAFFNLYLARKYGIQSVNSYFKYHSEDFLWPQFTNASLKKALGRNFEEELELFSNEYKNLSKNFVEAQGERIASSQFFSSLSNSGDEVLFLTNESGTQKPELVKISKKNKSIQKIRGSWLQGKVIENGGEYFTQGSRNVSPTRIYQGLFNQEALIKEGSESKMIQGYLSNGKAVYFDVASSYSEPQLYVGDEFYAQVNSSVIIDREDNLYYFKQEGKKRTLYKNRDALYLYMGFYGVVSDVDSQGNIYFVANSKLGSSVYAYTKEGVKRASSADNVREARLINDKELLIAAISDRDYYYIINYIEEIAQQPYETKLFFEEKDYYANNIKKSEVDINASEEYNSFLDMHYSGTDVTLYGYSSYDGIFGSVNAQFSDPLSQNSAELFVSRDLSLLTLAGASYSNSLSRLQYSLLAYGVADKNGRDDVKDGGVIIGAMLPLYQAGYRYTSVSLNYYQDYETLSRSPLSASVMFLESKSYGKAMYSDFTNMLNGYYVYDRGDSVLGASHVLAYGFSNEFYLGTQAKYSWTNQNSGGFSRGVKITNLPQTSSDPSSITMPSLEGTSFVKQTWYAEASLKKVFNLSAYFFTFPLSLQREALYTKYRHYNIKGFSGKVYKANETTLGATAGSVFVNSFVFPMSLEYIKTDASFVQDKEKFRIVLGATF